MSAPMNYPILLLIFSTNYPKYTSQQIIQRLNILKI